MLPASTQCIRPRKRQAFFTCLRTANVLSLMSSRRNISISRVPLHESRHQTLFCVACSRNHDVYGWIESAGLPANASRRFTRSVSLEGSALRAQHNGLFFWPWGYECQPFDANELDRQTHGTYVFVITGVAGLRWQTDSKRVYGYRCTMRT